MQESWGNPCGFTTSNYWNKRKTISHCPCYSHSTCNLPYLLTYPNLVYINCWPSKQWGLPKGEPGFIRQAMLFQNVGGTALLNFLKSKLRLRKLTLTLLFSIYVYTHPRQEAHQSSLYCLISQKQTKGDTYFYNIFGVILNCYLILHIYISLEGLWYYFQDSKYVYLCFQNLCPPYL